MTEATHRANPPPVDRLSTIWRRARQHKVVQWVVAYIAVAYGLQHGVILASESLQWPNAVARVSILLLVLGLPLIVTFAWYHGARASRNFSQAELSILSALLVIASLLFYVFVRPSETAAPALSQQASITAARTAAADPHSAISLAVLPFVNLSSDKEQEFFSDGMTEEITAALAKVPDLRVVGRTSAFQFKGTNKDLRAIGQALSATHLIEGSVRKAGNRLRITAQLIKADDGTHIWAEDYDRDLTDIFVVQEDIARAMTTSLRMPLGLKPGENLVNNRNIDPASYEQYLRASAIGEAHGGEPTRAQNIRASLQAASLLENVVSRNPSYAPAWWRLATMYYGLANYYALTGDVAEARARAQEYRAKSEAAGNKFVALDPNSPTWDSGSGWLAHSRGQQAEGDELFDKALQLDPLNRTALFGKEVWLGPAGHLKEALEFAEKAHALDALEPGVARDLVDLRWLNSQTEQAIALAKTLRPFDGNPRLALIYASSGRFGDAANALTELAAAGNSDSDLAEAARLLRNGPLRAPPAWLPRLGRDLEMLYLYLGAPDRALDSFQRMVDVGHRVGGGSRIWHPNYAPVRKTERFKTIMRKLGFVDYWRAKGWPPQCHPTTGDDFACN